MDIQKLKIEHKEKLAEDVYGIRLRGNALEIGNPGRFINIRVPGFYLRRPISIWDYDDDYIDIAFKVVGDGTKALAAMNTGDSLDVLGPLGNGFDTADALTLAHGGRPVLIGGGVGTPPLFGLARQLVKAGVIPHVILGFKTGDEVFGEARFKGLGIEPIITTEDGSMGVKGFVTTPLAQMKPAYVYTCGPEPMLKAVYDVCEAGQFSFEARMACGIGACNGCSKETNKGTVKICKDGPVLRKEDIIW